ncbi:MAG: VanZ family protein [Candidatus Aureabacteria bacterium]|nr:VanZ family protein [Candidatus Auribacterota bacterium]
MTVILALAIVASAAFARNISSWIRTFFGADYFRYAAHASLVFFAFILIVIFLKHHLSVCRCVPFFLLLCVTGIIVFRIKLPEEKIHFLEYGALAFLAARDVFKREKKRGALFAALAFCLFVGFCDEVFQFFLPSRFFDWRDLAFNGIGSAWGAVLYAIKPIDITKNKREPFLWGKS